MVLFNNPNVQTVFAGLVAALVMSFVMIMAKRYKEMKFNFYEKLGTLLNIPYQNKKINKAKGLIAHLIIGMLWAILYSYLAINLGIGLGIISSLIFSLIPWLFMMLILMPLLNAGIFGKDFNPRIRDSMLLFHLIYGAVLGIIASL